MSTPPPPQGPAAELYARVQEAAAGTPFKVTPTERGFDVSVDVSLPEWRELLYRQKVNQVFTFHALVDEQNKKLTVTDDLYEVEWAAGVGGGIPVPHLRASVSRQVGRSQSSGFSMTIGRRPDGSFGVIDKVTFSSEKGRRLITEAAKELGWSMARGWEEKLGIAMAIVGGVGALVAIVVVAIVFLIR